jgi:hypothetical protein
MFNQYRKAKLSTRLTVLGSILALAIAICFQYGYSIPIVSAVIVGFSLLLHIVATKSRALFATIVVVIQILIVGFSGEIIKNTYNLLGYDGSLAGLTFQSLSLLSIATLGTIAYRYVPGRLWVTLLAAFTLHNIAYLSLLAYNSGLFVSLIAGFAAAIVFFVLRTTIKKKTMPFILPKRNEKEIAKTKNVLEERMSFVESAENNPYVDYLALSEEKNKFYSVFTLDAKKTFKVQENEILVDGNSVTPLLELVIQNSKKVAKLNGIKPYNVIPVILSHNPLPSKRYVIKVNTRRKPDISIGSIVISTVEGLDKTLEAYKPLKPLKKKQLKAIS